MPRERKRSAKPKEEIPQPRPLYRSTTNRIIAGVAGGLSEYFDLDPILIRLIFILLAFFASGFGILLYFILWILIPEKDQASQHPKETIQANMAAFRERLRGHIQQRHLWGGIILVVLGLLFLSNNFGFFYGISLHTLWPVIFILLGIFLIYKHK